MKKIAVFGATGETGRYFLDALLHDADKYCIYAIGHRKSFHIFDDFPNVSYYSVDLANKVNFDKLPAEIDAVVDFAGLMPARMKGYEPQKYIDVNITGTLNVLEYARKAGADRILFMQSFGDIKDYGDTEVLLTAHMARHFSFKSDHTVYVLSKNFAVDLIQNYHEMYGIKNFIFRLPTIYSYAPEDHYYVNGISKPIGYKLLIQEAMQGKSMEVWGNPDRVKDMVYVKDFTQMVIKALKSNLDGGYYNVGTGVGTSLLDQIKGIIQVFGNNNPIIFKPEYGDAPQYIMDITPAMLELGYKPQFSYIEMLKDMKAEMESNRLFKDVTR